MMQSGKIVHHCEEISALSLRLLAASDRSADLPSFSATVSYLSIDEHFRS